MANQKLNEVTTVPTASINNVKTFLAVMNDNSIQQMTKEDMATVLGGLYTEIIDFNLAVTTGRYRAEFSYNALNRPSDDTFILEVTSFSNLYIVQRAYGINANSFYYRTAIGKDFKSWIKVN